MAQPLNSVAMARQHKTHFALLYESSEPMMATSLVNAKPNEEVS
jgi:hypothetical protein